MAAGAGLIRLAVFGSPIAQSLSPAIHGQFAKQFDLPVDYQAIESSIEAFPQALEKFVASGARGCNITAPLKNAAFEAANEVSPAASRARAVNTLVFRKHGEFFGTTTDGEGLLYDLQRFLPGNSSGGLSVGRVLVMGAGGAAAGVMESLLSLSPVQLVVVNRDVVKAEKLCQRFSDLGNLDCCTYENLAGMGAFRLVINATSLGHAGKAPTLPDDTLDSSSFCYDLNYGSAAEAWRTQCGVGVAGFSDGLGMLVEQAALSFELWTGKKPETQPVLDSMRSKTG